MRIIMLSIAALALTAELSAQGVFSNRTQSVLEKVIQDYPNHFHNIQGELITQAQQRSQYRSTLQLPGFNPSVIVLSTAAHDPAQRWSCTLSQLDNFDQARTRFKDLYSQLSNSIIRSNAQKTFILSGQYEEPDPAKKQALVQFGLLPAVGDLRKLHVLLIMNQQGSSWNISLSVDDQTAREETQGVVTTN